MSSIKIFNDCLSPLEDWSSTFFCCFVSTLKEEFLSPFGRKSKHLKELGFLKMWIHLAYPSDKKGRKYSERGDKNLEGDWFNLHLVTSQQLECVAFSFSTLWFLLGARSSEELLESEPSSCGANLMTFEPYKAKLTRSSVAFLVAFGFASSSSCLCLSPCSSPQMDQLLGSVMEMWVDRMDNITQPERRKLSSLALLSLLPSDNRCNTFSSSSHFHTLLPSASTSRKS